MSTSIRPLSVTAAIDPRSAPDSSGVIHQSSVTVDGNTEPGASVSLSTGSPGGPSQTTTADPTGAFSFSFDVPLGTTLAQFAVHDSFGQSASTSLSIVRANPTNNTQPPSIQITSPTSGLPTNANITVKGSVTDSTSPVATLEAALDGGTFTAVSVAGSNGAFQYATILPLNGTADGLHTIHFRATDRAGDVATLDENFTLDTIAPTITVTSPAEGAQVSTSPSVDGTVSDAGSGVASLQAQLDGGSFVTVTVAANGSFSFATGLATDGSADGPHTVMLQATDRAGNMATTEVDFTLNTSANQPPTITIASPASGSSVKVNPTIDGTVTGNNVTTLLAQVDSTAAVPVPFDASTGAFSFTPSLALDGTADGLHTVYFTATDASGNSTASDFKFTLDTIPPVQPAFALAAADRESGVALSTTDGQVTLTGQTDPNVSVQVMGTSALALSTNTGAFQIPNVPVTLGDNSLTVVATDAAGNTSQFQATIHRDSSSGGVNQVILWDQITLQAIEQDGSAAEVASRRWPSCRPRSMTRSTPSTAPPATTSR